MKLVWLVALAAACGAETWPWGQRGGAARIDSKVRFLNNQQASQVEKTQADAPCWEGLHSEGVLGRREGGGGAPPRGALRAPYRADDLHAEQRLHSHNYNSDGTLDSLQYCKCLSSPDCNPHQNSGRACGSGKFLCCYKNPYGGPQKNTEYFNEIEDERPMLLPGRESIGRPFPHPQDTESFFEPGRGHGASLREGPHRGVLIQPHGPGGNVANPGVLVGPGGPTGQIGPFNQNTGAFGDTRLSGKQNPGVLVGPGGPTGIIGPADANEGGPIGPNGPRETLRLEETAQRGVLVGPGGPTGIIGPQVGYGRRPVLVGPGGPTGIIGPRRPGYGGSFNNGYGRPNGRGVLVGPGRGLLVGPVGPTGVIGPQGYFGK